MVEIQPHHVPEHVDPSLVIPFNYRWAPDISDRPWDYLAEHAAGPDIFWSPELGGHWVIVRAALQDAVYRDNERFSNGAVSIPRPPRPQSIPASMDPPEHGKYRKILSQRLFSPRALEELVADVDRIGAALLADLAPRGACDFVSDFARPLPVGLLLKMLGLPEAVRADLEGWVREMFHGANVDQHLAGYQKAFGFLGAWLDDTLSASAPPEGMVMPAFLEARVDGRPLTRDEMHSMTMLLLGAGVDTVTSQMTHVARYFADHPAALKALTDAPDLIPRAVEELMRRYGIANIARVVRSDMTYEGVPMKAGDMVLCASALAGLDPKTFPDPMRVDFDRPNWKAHTPFGAGPHICPGAYLARTILRALIADILPALPGLRIAPGANMRHVSGITVSLTSLPLIWNAEGKAA